MSLPKIDRRCENCGATVARRVKFCPHCGESMGDKKKKAAGATAFGENINHKHAPIDEETITDEHLHADEDSEIGSRQADVSSSQEDSRAVEIADEDAEKVSRETDKESLSDEIPSGEKERAAEVGSTSKASHVEESPPFIPDVSTFTEENEDHARETDKANTSADETQTEIAENIPTENASSSDAKHDENSDGQSSTTPSVTVRQDDGAAHDVPMPHAVETSVESAPPEIEATEREVEVARPRAYSSAIFAPIDNRPTRLDALARAASGVIAEGKQRAIERFGETETRDDEGARFILIAAALFIIALVLLIFSISLK